MKIMNIGILAHVDAGKTTLTESMLYASVQLLSSGRVDRGSTITDSMALEKAKGHYNSGIHSILSMEPFQNQFD